MVKKRGLGKSLDALLAYSSSDASDTVVALENKNQEKLSELFLDQIQRGKYQPRREMDIEALEALANSIRAQGVIQPIIVRPVGNNTYEIIAGERRWRAAQMAELKTIPAVIKQIPDEAAMAIGLIENIQRENLNPIEESLALKRLIDEFGMTHQQVAESVGKSRVTVTNLLRLLVLPNEVKNMLEKGLIEMGHARTLVTLPEAMQLEVAQMITTRQLSVRETENVVRRLQAPTPINIRKPISPDIVHLQEDLSRQLHMRVAIQCNQKGRGKLVIHYRNLSELDKIVSSFKDE